MIAIPASVSRGTTSWTPRAIINTGTTPGVALGMPDTPYLRAGDVVELGISGLGRQRQRFMAAP